jgi:uncharacterized protein
LTAPRTSGDARVAALSIAPVKGLRIAGVDQLALVPGGAAGDRRFYLIEERGWMVNGKHSGALNEVIAEVDDAQERLALRFPDGTQVAGAIELGRELQTRFHSRPRKARLLRGAFSDALSEHAGERLRLVQPVDGSAIDRGAKGAASLISRASLAALARVAERPAVDGRRFRMTIELDGIEPFAEDAWLHRAVRVGEAAILVNGHVGRCIVTSRHPESGAVDLPTLELLRSFRSGLDTTEPLPFGVYGEVLRPGVVRVGDRVEGWC